MLLDVCHTALYLSTYYCRQDLVGKLIAKLDLYICLILLSICVVLICVCLILLCIRLMLLSLYIYLLQARRWQAHRKDVCSRMLMHAHVCSRMLTHADYYISVSYYYRQDLVGKLIAKTYAPVCSRMLTHADYYMSVSYYHRQDLVGKLIAKLDPAEDCDVHAHSAVALVGFIQQVRLLTKPLPT
jgi:Na+-transporting NADH:ubiquinone oxidoreductase subunit NqrC